MPPSRSDDAKYDPALGLPEAKRLSAPRKSCPTCPVRPGTALLMLDGVGKVTDSQRQQAPPD